MIKVKNEHARFKGPLPILAAELAIATRGLIDAHIDAGIPVNAALYLVRRCVELAFDDADEATGNAPESSEEDADV